MNKKEFKEAVVLVGRVLLGLACAAAFWFAAAELLWLASDLGLPV